MPRDTPSLSGDGAPALAERGRRSAADLFKRTIDIVGAAAGLVFLCPLLALVALAIVMESSGSPIFSQRRSGLGGKPFVIYKFRSMRVCEDGERVVQATRADVRVTRVGAFIRRTSVDELPQLFNVLRGDMSLVGPRPHALAHDDFYRQQIGGYDKRFFAKPGITGLAQVLGLRGGTEDLGLMIARVEKDIEYIATWSVTLDISILVRTVLIFAFHRAAY